MLLLGKIPHLNAVYIRGVMCLYIMQINERINLEGKCIMYVVWHTFCKDRIYSMVTFGIVGIMLLAGVSLAHNHQNPNQNFLLLRRYYLHL